MKTEFKGFTKVFSFTLRQQTKGKKFRAMFVIIALLCLILPAAIMSVIELRSDKNTASHGAPETTRITEVAVVDGGALEQSDYELLGQREPGAFSPITYIMCEDLNQAVRRTSSQMALILIVDRQGENYELQVVIPWKSELKESEASEYQDFINRNFQSVILVKSGLTAEQMAVVQTPARTEIHTSQDTGADGDQFGQLRRILSFVLPYVVIMGLYFMILCYGQGVANNVIQEKTSKLMDNLLLSVKPGALIMGKVLAIFTTGVVQTLLWVVCLVVGFVLGTAGVKAINPNTNMLLIRFFDSLDLFSGIFSITGIIFAIAIFLAGFLLYCSLSALGGSLASKQEDLGTTNMLFTLILIISFMASFLGGALKGNAAAWMYYVPFTAVLVAPGEALLGKLTLLQEGVSLGILAVTAVAAIWLAGKVYAMMVLYKGNPPSLGKVFGMLRGK